MFATHVDLATLSDYHQRGLLRRADHPTLPLSIYNYANRLLFGPRSAWDTVTTQCRGLIVNSRTGAIVARSFDKFFRETDDTSTAEAAAARRYDVYEKVDGSLGILFYYADTQQWLIASRGSFTGEQAQHAQRRVDGCQLDECSFDRHCSYVVEIVYPTNRIVVDYGRRDELILLAAYQQYSDGWRELYPLPADVRQRWADSKMGNVVHHYTTTELQSLPVDRMHQLDWPNREGFVVRYDNGVRLKVKFATYKQLHARRLDYMTPAALLATYRAGRSIDAVADAAPDEFHEWIRQQWTALQRQYDRLRDELVAAVSDVVGEVGVSGVNQKVYAERVLSHTYVWKNEMFVMRQLLLLTIGGGEESVEEEKKRERLEVELFGILSKRVEMVEVSPTDVTGPTVADGEVRDEAVQKLVDEMKTVSIG